MEKENKKLKEPTVLLITCYKRKYTEESLSKIRSIINKIKPDRIIILKVIQKIPDTEMVDANIGYSDREKLKETIERLKKDDADELGSQLIQMIDKLDIPYEVHFRIGDMISEEIVDEYKCVNVIGLIMHRTPRSHIDKLIEPSTEDKVVKKLGKKNIIFLE